MTYDKKKLEQQVAETEAWLVKEFSGVRTGRATPALLDSVKVEAYGTKQSITQLGSISVEDARTLRIVPWDMTQAKAVEKGIVEADLGVGVATDDHGLRVTFPELTADRRTQLLKIARDKAEQARITLRGHRTESMKALEATEKEGGMGKDDLKRLKDEVQKQIDAGTKRVAELLEKKEEEISQ